jgi:lysophospholipase L1-like esterase
VCRAAEVISYGGRVPSAPARRAALAGGKDMSTDKYVVRAYGDSIMWGQGLPEEKKFVHIVAKYLASLYGKEYKTPIVGARSGALLARPANDAEARRKFMDIYGEVLPNDAERNDFRGGNDFWASNLHPEVPADYPTVEGQLEFAGTGSAAGQTDLLLLNGGANDAEFPALLAGERVLPPAKPGQPFRREKISIEDMNETLQRVMYTSFREVLRRARSKFTNALIVVPGYYPVFSSDSDRGKLRDTAEKLEGGGSSAMASVVLAGGLATLFGLSAGLTGLMAYVFWKQKNDIEKAEEALDKAIKRAEFIFTRANYWMARAAAETQRELGGPGIIYVHPGLGPENSAFASSVSYLFEDLAPTTDPAREQRLRAYPRDQFVKDFEVIDGGLNAFFGPEGQTNPHAQMGLALAITRIRHLSPLPKGPAGLLGAIWEVQKLLRDAQPDATQQVALVLRLRELHHAVKLERANFQVVELASFLHPNEQGAKKYADAIVGAVKKFKRADIKNDMRKLAAQMPNGDMLGDARVLRAYGLDPEAPPGELAQTMSVYSLAVLVETESQRKLSSVRLVAGNGRSWPLDTPLDNAGQGGVEFSKGRLDLFTFDTQSPFHLSELAGLGLVLDGEYWNPGAFTLFVNGRRLRSFAELHPVRHGERLMLEYPRATPLQPTPPPVG